MKTSVRTKRIRSKFRCSMKIGMEKRSFKQKGLRYKFTRLSKLVLKNVCPNKKDTVRNFVENYV